MKRIGILLDGFDGWGGGVRFVELISSALTEISIDHRIRLFIFYTTNTNKIVKNLISQILRFMRSGDISHLYLLPAFKIIKNSAIKKQLLFPTKHLVFCNYIGTLHALKKVLNIKKIEILILSSKPLNTLPIPWIGYLPDCQHKHFPNFFSHNDLMDRDKYFINMLESAKDIIVNSHEVKKDLFKFYKSVKKFPKIHVLLFSPVLNKNSIKFAYDISSNVCQNFGVGKHPFFIISNQFWIHKDHRTAFLAFSKFIKSDKKFKEWRLICTGSSHDSRSPEYFDDLKSLLVELNISKNVIMTGYINREDQLSLIASSVSMLQPTKFEGGPGGGSVYDAIALGVPCIVSNIPINYEISSGRVNYFNLGDFNEMAELMISAAISDKRTVNVDLLIKENQERLKKLSKQLICISKAAVKYA